MNRLGHIATVAMFWLLVGPLLLSEGKPPLAIATGLILMTAPCFAEGWVRSRHRARAATRGPGAGADGVSRPLLRDIGIAALAGLACCALALWVWLNF